MWKKNLYYSEDVTNIAEQENIRIDVTHDVFFAILSLFARPPVIVTLYDREESLLAVGEEFQRLPHFSG